MFQNIYNILCTFLGNSKQGYYSSDTEQYQFDCCRCADENGGIPDGKHNLEVLLSATKGLKYHCWKCGDTDNMKGNLSQLIKKYGGSELYKEFKDELTYIKKGLTYDISLYSGATINIEDNFLKLPKTFTNIDLSTIRYKKLTDYLNERGITQDIIDRYHIGFTQWNDDDWSFRSKIIIPSYDSFGDLNFFVGRDFTGKSKIKYKNCDADKKKIVFQESLINWDSDIFLVEGAIDCLMLPNSISLLGKSLMMDSELFSSLVKKSNGKIVICLDGDTNIEETKRIYNILNFGRLRNKIWYIDMSKDSKYKDFGDVFSNEGKMGMINLIRKMKQFEEIDLVF